MHALILMLIYIISLTKRGHQGISRCDIDIDFPDIVSPYTVKPLYSTVHYNII